MLIRSVSRTNPLKILALAAFLAVPALSMPTVVVAAEQPTLYERLGGYDAITAVTHDVAARLMADPKMGRFWAHRGKDGIDREVQLIIDFIANQAGGPRYYTGRDMKLTHIGMRIDGEDWDRLITHLKATLDKFNVPEKERADVVAFFEGTRKDIVEVK
ncbi:group I truncated hemoglobin [Cohaesibacter gelatinilyticus]|uniref:Hemoglobin n=1 Tax=Cohaesibacter gelatinilyticus TaxID=372072 RepID=A0A285PJF8_9HYPH|nr:group 1 truncated hemoglobin [Cohaesibacter gelatinilyticus]SNZ20011.1 hemoglobin [Cohaesibacter gelatinilyticus]